MSKIAENKAEERFPLHKIDNGSTEAYYNAGQLNHRRVYIEAYDQAMQDFLEKAEKFLEKQKRLSNIFFFKDFIGFFREQMMED